MNSNNFRVGNLLEDRVGRLCRVETITLKEGFKAPAIKGGMTSLPNKPIPLTEEWMVNFGFTQNPKKSPSFWQIESGSSSISINPNNGVVWIYNPMDEAYNPNTLICYVHELQNFCYSLMGKELILKQ